MRIDCDLHIHSYLSACSNEKDTRTPGAIVSLAEEMGLRAMGFADHLWTNPNLAPSEWYRPQDESQISRIRNELEGICSKVRVLVGCEAETIAPGKFGITRAFADQLDFVLLACSHFHQKEFVEQPDGDSPQELGKHIMKFFRSAVSSGLATSIPHPLIPCGSLDKFDEAIASLSDAELQDAFGLAQSHRVALEITVGFIPNEKRPFSIETPIRFLSLAKQAGCKFTLGTDAHSFKQQKRLQELRPLVEALQLTDEDEWCAV
ncbi:MAG TPA: hypothetical protein PKH07_04825 [bacterium]|nr:hypothetical protein [bacterium]